MRGMQVVVHVFSSSILHGIYTIFIETVGAASMTKICKA